MSTQPPRRIDRDTAERILRGDPAALRRIGPAAVPLRMACSPAHPDELAGEQAALRAFQDAAGLTHVPQQRRPTMLKIALAKLLTVKAAAATTTIIAATGVGGVALAASTGVLPNPLVDTPATPSATHAPATPGSPTATAPHPAGDVSASPSPSLLGLCQAYTAGAAANPGKALDNPAFTMLIKAAGGADHVNEYCDALTAAASAGAIPGRPGSAPAGAGHPTAAPTPKAGGAPTSRPETPATRPPAGTATAVPGGPPAAPASR